jgi:acyl dehydratase
VSAGPTLAKGTWDEAEAMVGDVIGRLEPADRVSVPDIRRKLEVVALDCPIHYDEDAARAQGYRTIVSPVSMARVWAMPAYWRPGDPPTGAEPMTTPIPATSVPGEGSEMIAVGVRMEYLRPVYPGDTVTATAVLKAVTRKRTRVGKGAFLVVESTYRNQDDEAVATETATVFRFDPVEDQ